MTNNFRKLQKLTTSEIEATRQEASENGFDYREGEIFNIAEANEQKSRLLTEFSDKLDNSLLQKSSSQKKSTENLSN